MTIFRHAAKTAFLAATALFVVSGCSSGLDRLAPIAAAPPGPQPLETGDSIRVMVNDIEDGDGQYVVNGAGTVTLPFVGELAVRGLTIAQAQANIVQAYRSAGIFVTPEVNVQPAVLRPYYVAGEVNRPGEFAYRQGMTVQAAISAAGGYTYRAKSDVVEITRTVNGREVVGAATKLTPITPGDRVRVLEKWF